MTQNGSENRDDEMREERDFSQLKRVDRDAFFERLLRARGARILNRENAEQFPDDERVNAALGELVRLRREST